MVKRGEDTALLEREAFALHQRFQEGHKSVLPLGREHPARDTWLRVARFSGGLTPAELVSETVDGLAEKLLSEMVDTSGSFPSPERTLDGRRRVAEFILNRARYPDPT